MGRQMTKALASLETDQARLPRPLAFKKCILLYSSSIDGLRHGAKLEIKKKGGTYRERSSPNYAYSNIKKASTCLIGVLNSIKEILVQVCTY